MRCTMADETLHLCDLYDYEELDEFDDDWLNEIDAQTAAMVKAPLRELAVRSPIETMIAVATVYAPMQVDVKVTNTGDLEFTMEMLIRCWTRIKSYLISDGGNAKVDHINTDTR